MRRPNAEFVDVAIRAAEAGGSVIRRLFGSGVASWEKAPCDYVSDADIESERLIESVLREADPTISFVGEESDAPMTSRCWVVDPLDGTTNFLHGYPSVAVSVALVEDGAPVLAAVHGPFIGATFWAAAGHGAWTRSGRLGVSHRPVPKALCATGIPYRRPERVGGYLEVLEQVLSVTADVRRISPVSLDLAFVAAGVFDGVFEIDLKPCDVAAGALLVKEAGGEVSDWSGGGGWLRQGEIVAGSPAVHDMLVSITRARPRTSDRASRGLLDA